MKKRLLKSKYIINHKLMLLKLWFKYKTKVSLYRIICHDLIKLFNTLIFGVEIASKWHRKYARHHNIKTDKDFYEAYLDWASARYTKKDKPLDALQTAELKFPNLLNKALIHYKQSNFK